MVTNFGGYDFLLPPRRARAAVAAAVLGLSALGIPAESAAHKMRRPLARPMSSGCVRSSYPTGVRS